MAKAMKHPIEELAEDPRNPRRITEEALAGLDVSLTTFGDLSGIVHNAKTGHLVAGHQRMKTLRAAGATDWTRTGPDAGFVVDPRTRERFGIRIVEWDETTERLANLSANNPEVQGSFTIEAVAQLEALKDEERFAGLRLAELAEQAEQDLVRELDAAAASTGNADPDAAVEPPAVAISKRGDLWILGDHRLICGDSTDAADIARLMGGGRAVLMNTDPPYGVALDPRAKSNIAEMVDGRHRPSQDVERAIENDDLVDGPALQAFLEAAIRTALPHLDPRCAFYLWHPMLTQGTFFAAAAAAAAAADILIHRQIVWVKPHLLLGFGDYHWRHELCFYGWVRGKRPHFYGERNQTTIWTLGNETAAGARVHPTQKPVALFEAPMLNHTRPGEICFEPFSGSGSQIIAGEKLGRRVYACELEPRYVDAAVARFETFSGKKAQLASR